MTKGLELPSPYYFEAMVPCHVDFMGAGGLAQRLSILVKMPAIITA